MSRNKVWVASVLAGAIAGGTLLLSSAPAEARVRREVLADAGDDRRLPEDDAPPATRRAPRGAAADEDPVRDRDRGARDPRVGDDEDDDGGGRVMDEREARRRRVNDSDWFRDRSYREDYEQGDGFPSGEMRDFVVANARAATARMMFRRAESALGAAIRQAKRSFEASAELKEALDAEREAHQAYERARREALAAVVSDPKYQAIVAMHRDLGEQVMARRREVMSAGGGDTRFVVNPADSRGGGELFNTAVLRLHVAGDARAMEREAIEASEDLRAARERLMTAARRITDMRAEFDTRLREDEDLAAARQVLEDARVARVTAAAYLRGSRLAADEAVDFAYYLHRYDENVLFNPYDNYGYGYRYAVRGVRY